MGASLAHGLSASTAQADALRGTPYRTLRPLAYGGMAEVLLAEHVATRRRFAVKILREVLAVYPKYVDRMRVEAESLFQLRHPNVVAIHDFARTPRGRPYLVLERLHGLTLRDELRLAGELPLEEALRYVRQVLSALGAAHALGIVHRDVKLDNVFVHREPGSAPSAKLLDFGIAKILRGVSARAPQPQLATDEGLVIGTPRYVSPEAALGRPVDGRADLYSAGLVLYALLCGRGPWDEVERGAALIEAQASRRPEPPSRFARRTIPPLLDEAVLRALEKDPRRRFQSARELRRALEAIERPPDGLPGRGDSAGSEPARAAPAVLRMLPVVRRWLLIAALIALTVAATLIAVRSAPHASGAEHSAIASDPLRSTCRAWRIRSRRPSINVSAVASVPWSGSSW